MKPFKILKIDGNMKTNWPKLPNNLAIVNQAIKNCDRIGIEAECVVKDEFGNSYKVIHTYYMGKDEIDTLLNTKYYYQDTPIEKNNLLHLNDEGVPMVVSKFRVIITRWDKQKIRRALDDIKRIRKMLIYKKEALMVNKNVNSRRCVVVQFNSGHRITTHIPYDD